MGRFYAWLGARKSARPRLAVMDMWKPFRLATQAHAPQRFLSQRLQGDLSGVGRPG